MDDEQMDDASRGSGVLVGVGALVALVGVGVGLFIGWLVFDSDDESSVTTVPETTLTATTTTVAATTTSVPAPTTTSTVPATTTAAVVTTTERPGLTLGQLIDAFNADQLGDSASGAELECGLPDDTRVGFGTVLYCEAVPEDPDTFETGTIMLVLVDDDGTIAFTGGTDVFDIHANVGSGLFCRDLRALPILGGLRPETQYLFMLAYWFQDGQPDRMDADRNGIPCETLFEAEVVEAVWAGGSFT